MTVTGNGSSWQQYFQQLHAYLKWQTDQIRTMNHKIESLQKEQEDIKQQKGVRIDRIEYSFDQLKVERLEGTLNIGVTSDGVKSLEDFAANTDRLDGIKGTNGIEGKTVSKNGVRTNGSYANDAETGNTQQTGVSKVGQGTMTDNGQMAEQPLDHGIHRFVNEEIRKHIDDQIRLFMNQSVNKLPTNDIETLIRGVIENTKRDISIALDQYVSGLTQQQEGVKQ